jgi:hypothetical protein
VMVDLAQQVAARDHTMRRSTNCDRFWSAPRQRPSLCFGGAAVSPRDQWASANSRIDRRFLF